MENPMNCIVQISEMVKDRTSTSMEFDVPSLVREVCSILGGTVVAEAPDSLVFVLFGICNSIE